MEEIDLGGCKDGVGVSLAEELFEAAARQVGEKQGGSTYSDLLRFVNLSCSLCETHATLWTEMANGPLRRLMR